MGYGYWCPECGEEASGRCRCSSRSMHEHEATCPNGHWWLIKNSLKKGPFTMSESDDSKKVMDDLKRLMGITPATNHPPGGLRPFRPDPDAVGPMSLPLPKSDEKK